MGKRNSLAARTLTGYPPVRGSLFRALTLTLLASAPHLVLAEMQKLGEKELSAVSGQSGLSIEIPHLRVNAYGSESVDNTLTPGDEGDGRRTKGFTLDYVTREHGGGGESHFFIDEVSLAVDITGPITLDIEEDGALLIGLPDRINYVGDGLSLHGIYLNSTGTPDPGTKMLNEINVQGNFNTGGTVRMWSD